MLNKSDKHGSLGKGYIAVDLDGTLAHYDGWKGYEHIGKPIPAMLERVKEWIDKGKEVRILTARAAPRRDGTKGYARRIDPIKQWLKRNVGKELPITYKKDSEMLELWDDRAVQVEPNTGQRVDGEKSMSGIEELEEFVKGGIIHLDELEIPEDFAIEVLGLDRHIQKSRSHKYIRRVPYSDKSGKIRYRYYYNVTGGKGVGSHDEMIVGAKFKVVAKDGHEEGHLLVQSVTKDVVKVKHDETGKIYTLPKEVLSELLHRHHLKSIKIAHDKARKIHQAAEKHGSEKQKARAKERYIFLQSKFNKVLGDEKEILKEDIKDYAQYRKAISSIYAAEQAIEIAAKSVKDGARNRKKAVENAIVLSSEANQAIGTYIKMLYDMGDDRKGPDAMALKNSRKKLAKEIRDLEELLRNTDYQKRLELKKKNQKNKVQKRIDDLRNRKEQGWNLGGKTYDWYDQIKKAGGVWDKDNREWLMPSAEAKASITSLMQEAEDKKKEKKKTILSEKDRRRQEGFIIRGNTYQHKDEIKRAGGLWDPDNKTWLMPDHESFLEMNRLINPEKAKMKVMVSEQLEHEKAMSLPASDITLRDIYTSLNDIKDKAWGLGELNKLGLGDVDLNSDELKTMTEGRAIAIKDALQELIRTNGQAGSQSSEWTSQKNLGSVSRSSGYSYDGPYRKGEVLEHPKHGLVVVTETSQKYFSEEGMSFGVGDEQGYIYSAKVRAPTPQEAFEFEKKKAKAELIRTQDARVHSIGSKIMSEGEIPYFGKEEGSTYQTRGKVDGNVIFDTHNIYGGGNRFVLEPDNETVWFIRNNGADGDDWSRSNVMSGIGWRIKDRKIHTELQELHDAKEKRI